MLLKGADCLTKDDKKVVRDMCKEAELPVTFKGGCPNCYADALILLANHYGVVVSDSRPRTETKGGRWVYLKSKPTMWFHGKMVTRMDAETSDEDIEAFRAENPNIFGRFYERKEVSND